VNVAHLLEPLEMGRLLLPNRIVMAPMTRYRVDEDGTANALMATHFADRADAGLLICEGGFVHPSGRLGAYVGGLTNERHVAGWKLVTDAVHARGGRIFIQLMHGGRISHAEFQEGGRAPMAPSAVRPANDQVRINATEYVPTECPREMSIDEIAMIVECYGKAAELALQAGFDGVELHAGNGYLPHQFLATNTNQRSDGYGGSLANRCRFTLDVLDRIVQVNGAEFVGMKVSPVTTHHDTHDADPRATYDYLIPAIEPYGLAYLTVQSTMDFVQPEPPLFDVHRHARPLYKGVLFAAGNLDRWSGEALVAEGIADAAVYGRRYLANPDLVTRFAQGLDENEVNWDNFVSTTAEGYNDYPRAQGGASQSGI